ncbi:ThuA domain-containing protein [Solirubrobacter phytolaccae]|uniref:ThuA domain-containing protein n=1 Tax=Solirubrobacter phytolaccae TaxID=1404360 RepID=A0A9X3SCN7_9ACTN|nr:ThuA domain-containing protein [Solirubrobacter phytolaccae]MDA0184926.1 ThuA domain-containing protein [Solirubrobacter phytolaccae]
MLKTVAALAAVLVCLTWTALADAQAPVAGDFQKVTLDDNTQNPMELDVAPDGRVFYIERDGRLMIWKPNTQQTVTAGTVPVTRSQENGLLGLQLAPDFATSKWVYLFYSQLPDSSNTQVVARFKVNGDTLDLASEQKILTFTHQRGQCCHSGGSMYFGPDGSLYVATGDNTNPFDSGGYNPIDERAGRSAWDAQRTSANTNDLNGKILRIKPVENPTGTPGLGNTYTVPPNNLFAAGVEKTRPEIFAMGFRNPFRITVDSETGWVLSSDYGPDAGTTNANRGPQGSVEYNVVPQAGNYGWPYCIRDNVQYNDYNFETSTSGAKFDCSSLKNDSPNNTGLTDLPPAQPASAWMGFGDTDPRFRPNLGTGGAPMGGPRYHFDASLDSDRKFPAFYDDKWFIAEWNNGWIKTANLNAAGGMTAVDPFALGTGYKRPMDLDFGPDGALYVIEWGSGFGGDNADSGVYRIDYVAGNKAPVAEATASVTNGLAPLAVQFNSTGSADPEGEAITYAWDFNSDGTVDSTAANPSYTYTANGAYTAKLTVRDAGGLSAVENILITVGNRAPTVTIETPLNGKLASFTDKIPYKVTVTDPEDGSTGSGIDCSQLTVKISLGHDEHAHDLSSAQGCEGTLTSGLTAGHGPEANTFTVISVSYTDKGGALALTGRAEAILQPKQKQAEFFASTGRVPDGTTGGTAGVQIETTTDVEGGGSNVGFIEDGDYTSYKPFNLADISEARFRVASAGPGGTIELRYDSPTGPLLGKTAMITPTGNWQTYKNVSLPLTGVPSGTHELFVITRNPGQTASLLNLNWIDFVGKGAAQTAAPDVTSTATPLTGAAPLPVKFETTATDPDGGTLSYAWDFGVPGTTTDTSTAASPSYTYANQGNYTATLTVTDGQGGTTIKTFAIKVNAPAGCGTNYRDDFDGADLGAGWDVVRRDQGLVVGGGTLKIPTAQGDVYGGDNNAKNIVLRAAPGGPWTITSKIKHSGNRQYHQAGLIVYGDDDNYTKFDRLADNTPANPVTEHFEFINEVAGTPRNGSADSGPQLGGTYPQDFFMKIESDGTQIRGYQSTNGTDWTVVGQPANLPTGTVRVGMFSLGNAAATAVTSEFDWFTLTTPGGGGGGAGDEFDGTSLDKTRWNAITREDTSLYSVGSGGLTMTLVQADVGGANNKNYILQTADHTSPDYVLETKLSAWTFVGQYRQAGILIYGDDANFIKFNAISDATNTRINRMEIRSRTAGVTANGPNLDVPAGVTGIWLRLTKSGTNYQAEASFNGTTWQNVGTPVTNVTPDMKFGLYTAGVDGAGGTATFDYFKVNGSTGCGGSANTPPVITSASATPTAGFAPLAVNVAAAASDANGDALTYSWDFDGNGTADATGATASTTFNTAGNRTVKLTVSDGKGGTATRDIPVQVLAADDPSKKLRALVFSKTGGFRHDAIPAGVTAIQGLATAKGWQVDSTEDASLFTSAVLSHYDVVIFNSTTGDVLNAAQQTAFEAFIKSGKGYVGIHAAADTEYDWHWYGSLVGAYFRNHPAGTPNATVIVEDLTDVSTQGLPARWARTDEWYNYKKPDNSSGDDYSPRSTPGVHVLLTMDEATYAEDDGNATDDDHPISWCQRYDGGRSWYTGMGHTQATFQEAGFLSHLGSGIEIAAGVLPSAACGVAPQEPGDKTEVPVEVGGTVPGTLALALAGNGALGPFLPGQTKDYTGQLTATVTSSSAASALTVRDPSATAPGRLVNGALALEQPLQLKVGTGAFGALNGTGLALTTFSTPVGARAVPIDLKQSIAATESLLTGSYKKTVVFTLSTTTP